jgi:hypothetical protein
MLNFEAYLNRLVENVEQQPDARKFSIVADYFKTSVSLVKLIKDNVFLAETPIGDKLAYCLSEEDIDNNYHTVCDKISNEAVGLLYSWQPSYIPLKRILQPCKIIKSNFPLTEIGTYKGIWSADIITLENGQTLTTDVGIRGTSKIEVDFLNGQATVYKYLKPEFHNDTLLKNCLLDIFKNYYTKEDVIQHLLQKMSSEWFKTTEVLYQGYKLYLPI